MKRDRLNRSFLCLVGLALTSTLTLAQSPVLVSDINDNPSSRPRHLVEIDGTLFFMADDGVHGRELWRSDGTENGTVLIKDINPNGHGDGTLDSVVVGPDGSISHRLPTSYVANQICDIEPLVANVAGSLFFVGPNSLWKSDGTGAGTVLVRDFNPRHIEPLPRYLTGTGETLLFAVTPDDPYSLHNGRLWRSDGTEAGTVPIPGVPPLDYGNLNDGFCTEVVRFEGAVLFTAGEVDYERWIWRTDGTDNGTTQVTNLLPYSNWPPGFVAGPGVVYFRQEYSPQGVCCSEGLWKTDGTAVGTVFVADVSAGSYREGPPEPSTMVKDTLFLVGNDGRTGWELWRSDGTEAGTHLVKDIHAKGHPGPSDLFGVDATLFFTADDGAVGAELWKSDGTEAGTVLVRDIRPGAEGSEPRPGLALNGQLLFSADDGTNGRELWKSDGTEAGTMRLRDITRGRRSSLPENFTLVGNTAFFTADDGSRGQELWKTDGTESGTVLVKDINTANHLPSFPRNLTSVGGKVYLSATTEAGPFGNNFEPWVSDGTDAGTISLGDANGLPLSSSDPREFSGNEEGSFFIASRTPPSCTLDCEEWRFHGFWIMRSDATAEGTSRVKEFPESSISGVAPTPKIHRLTSNGKVALFNNYDLWGEPNGLWSTDGTPDGTRLLHPDIIDGGHSFTVLDGIIFFSAGYLWRSDGTDAGTYPLDVVAESLTVWNGFLYFTSELWQIMRSDGTAEGTIPIAQIPTGAPWQLTGFDAGLLITRGPYSLWVTDGQPGSVASPVKEFTPDGDDWELRDFTGARSTVFFVEDRPEAPILWRSDGTPEGTFPLREFDSIQALNAVDCFLMFAADDGEHGSELWRSDGTLAGTALVSDLYPGPTSALQIDGQPAELVNHDGTLFFAADDGRRGTELWKTPIPCRTVCPLSCYRQGGDVELSWTSSQAYEAIVITRDEEVIATLDGNATDFVDTSAPAGQLNYRVQADCGGGVFSLPIGCKSRYLPCTQITNIHCVSTDSGDIELSWQNNASYLAIDVYRDSDLVVTLPGDYTSYVDHRVPAGSYGYEFRASCEGQLSSAPIRCHVAHTCESVTGLVCAVNGSVVDLSWDLGDTYSRIAVIRDGEVREELPGDAREFLDPGVPTGEHTYEIEAHCGSINASPATCTTQTSVHFLRGDADADGVLNGLADALRILEVQFQGGPPPPCPEATDADGDSVFNGIVDGLYLLGHQFQGGAAPPAPYPACGPDPDPGLSLGCDPYPGCY